MEKKEFFDLFGSKYNAMDEKYLTQMLSVAKSDEKRLIYEYSDHGLRLVADFGYMIIVTVDSFVLNRNDNFVQFPVIRIKDDVYVNVDFVKHVFTNMICSDYPSKVEECLDMISKIRVYKFGSDKEGVYIKVEDESYCMLVKTLSDIYDIKNVDEYYKYLFSILVAVCNRYGYNGMVGDLNMVFNQFGMPIISKNHEMGEYKSNLDELGEIIKEAIKEISDQ